MIHNSFIRDFITVISYEPIIDKKVILREFSLPSVLEKMLILYLEIDVLTHRIQRQVQITEQFILEILSEITFFSNSIFISFSIKI